MAEPYINGSRKLGDFEYQKFREDSVGKPSISVCNPDKSDITSTIESNQTNGSQVTKITDSWGVIFTNGLFLTITAANCNCQVIYE